MSITIPTATGKRHSSSPAGRILIVDVGGSDVKLWRDDGQRREFDSGRRLTARQMVDQALEATRDWNFEAIALGLPCHVVGGHPVDEPGNLGTGWVDFDYEKAFGKPVRIINDSDLQALGSYDGGRMLFLGFGTGLGSTLVTDHVVISLELGRLRHTDGIELGDLLGKANRRALGRKKWSALVLEIAPQLQAAVAADHLVLGGGGAKHLDEMPAGARRGGNGDVVAGGLRLWSDLPHPAEQRPEWRLA